MCTFFFLKTEWVMTFNVNLGKRAVKSISSQMWRKAEEQSFQKLVLYCALSMRLKMFDILGPVT